jgi:ankyrin repeat protein
MATTLDLGMCAHVTDEACLVLAVRNNLPTSSQDGNTALKFAAEEGHTDCVRLLLECGADIDVENKVRGGVELESFLLRMISNA